MRSILGVVSLVFALTLFLAPLRVDAADSPILRIEAGGHIGEVHQVLFAGTGDRLVSVGSDKVVRIWDVASGRQTGTLRSQIGLGITGEIYAAALSGQNLAVGGNDYVVRVYNLTDGSVTQVLTGYREAVTSLAFSPDGATLASSSVDKNVKLWDWRAGKALKTLSGHTGYVLGVAFSPDGRYLASASFDGSVRIWDVVAGKAVKALDCESRVQCVAWARSGALAAGAEDRLIRIWDNPLSDAKPLQIEQPDTVTRVAFSPDGSQLISGSGVNEAQNDRRARVWSVKDGKELARFSGHTATVSAVAFSPDGKSVASGDIAGPIYLWNPESGQVTRRLATTGIGARAVAWSRNGQRIAWGVGEDGRLGNVFDLYHCRPSSILEEFNKDETWATAITTLNGRRLELFNDPMKDLKAVIVKDAAGREVQRIEDKNWKKQDRIYCAAFTPQGHVAVGRAGGLSVYDVSGQPRLIADLVGHNGIVLSVAASPDGKYVASGSADQTLRIWRLADKPRFYEGYRNAITPLVSLFAGRDGEWVAWNDATGYYAASPVGDDIIGWHVNQGERRAAVFHRAFQFRSRFYRPDVICRLLEDGTVETALKNSVEIRNQQLAERERERLAALKRLEEEENNRKKLAEERRKVEEQAERDRLAQIEKQRQAEREEQKRAELEKKRLEEVERQKQAAEKRRQEQEAEEKRLAELRRQQEEEAKRQKEAQAQREREAAAPVVANVVANEIVKSPPPAVEVVNVEGAIKRGNMYVAKKGEVAMRVQLDGASPADAQVFLFVNKPQGAKKLEDTDEKANQGSLSVSLKPGMNRVGIQAKNAAGYDGQKTFVEIFYEVEQTKPKRNLYLLSIGISRYNITKYSLQYAAGDARSIATYYAAQNGLLFDNIILKELIDGEATKAGILAEFDAMAKLVGPDDLAMVFVSSHGYLDRKAAAFYMVPVDTDDTNISGSCIPYRELLQRLQNLPCSDAVLMLDHCHAGGVAVELRRAESPEIQLMREAREVGERQMPNVSIFASSLPTQKSWELEDARQGAFTLALLEGLDEKAPATPDGKVMMRDVKDYIVHRVQDLVAKLGQQQTPKLYHSDWVSEETITSIYVTQRPK